MQAATLSTSSALTKADSSDTKRRKGLDANQSVEGHSCSSRMWLRAAEWRGSRHALSKHIVIGLVRILTAVGVTLSHGTNYRFSNAVIPNCFDIIPDATVNDVTNVYTRLLVTPHIVTSSFETKPTMSFINRKINWQPATC